MMKIMREISSLCFGLVCMFMPIQQVQAVLTTPANILSTFISYGGTDFTVIGPSTPIPSAPQFLINSIVNFPFSKTTQVNIGFNPNIAGVLAPRENGFYDLKFTFIVPAGQGDIVAGKNYPQDSSFIIEKRKLRKDVVPGGWTTLGKITVDVSKGNNRDTVTFTRTHMEVSGINLNGGPRPQLRVRNKSVSEGGSAITIFAGSTFELTKTDDLP